MSIVGGYAGVEYGETRKMLSLQKEISNKEGPTPKIFPLSSVQKLQRRVRVRVFLDRS